MLFGRFRDSVARHPEAVAVEVVGESARYRELLDLAERLASRLVDVAGGAPRAVGLLAGRSLAAYAGYLAALRTGAAVVPLGPDHPVARNLSMCRAARLDVLVADDAGAAQATELTRSTTIATVPLRATGSTPWYWRLDDPAYAEPDRSDPEDVAYVLFTSGSTGEPKGVPIRHRHLAEYLPYCVGRYATGPDTRFVQAFELTFDLSVFAMFVAWCSGGTVVVPRSVELLDPPRLVGAHGLTHWFSVPSVIGLARRQRALPPGSMPDLRWSLFCGEPLTREAARVWADAAPHSVIDNLYGPTELTIACADYRLPSDPARWPETTNGTVPIGRVLPHLESTVLGEDGELCVRGSQRFDGYLDPAHNADRFVRIAGGRAEVVDETPVPADAWYRTGDRVSAGLPVHLGRLDDQIKIHGYRVELGEIESVLRGHPGVLDAVVVLAGSGLCAAYTGTPVDPAALAALAEERLPPYMRPERYRHLAELPVNANGKVDRRRLATELTGLTA